MKPPPKAFLQAVATHRNRLERLAVGQAVSPLKKLYDEAQASLVKQIAKHVKAKKGDTFTVHQQRQVLVQLREGQRLITQRMAGKLGPLGKKAQEAALKGLSADVSKLSKVFTGAEVTLPIDEAAVFAGVINRRAPSLLQQHATSMARYGANVVGKVEKGLALSLLKGGSSSEAIDDVGELIDGEWWQGERIVRTEMAYAFNATHADGMLESAADLPALRMRWEEHCDNAGNPLDQRVAVDSLAMHGQVALPGGVFVMPPTAPVADTNGVTKVPSGLVGLSWDFPPNRPNDRAVLSPWMPDWGIPGWAWSGSKRIQL
jgi:hypothetical protein